MCDYFWQRRENGQGDLADVVRSGGSAPASGSEFPVVSDWHPPLEPTVLPSSSTVEGMNNDFGDPFVNLCDPLLSELTGIEFFHNSGEMIAGGQVKAATESSGSGGGGGGGGIMSQHLLMSEEMITKPRDIIPRAFQLSSGGAKHSPLSPIEASGGAVGCSADDGGVQISSTRSLGVKRRKNQAKKVVCIPAPAAATNRPSGEVVPSDLWAWRKYGQKPIKGSPYPRGYYRCSSSKGCSARKQVERSRTNPNMLVITYTSEHNHPWPTQRNALAGSTRSQASKNSSSSSKNSFGRNLISPAAPKADPKVKEEEEEEEEEEAAEIDNEPMIPESNHPDDFFADLAELETDPMSPVFSKVLIQAKHPEEEEEPEDKGLGPLNMCKRVKGGRKSSGMMEDGTES